MWWAFESENGLRTIIAKANAGDAVWFSGHGQPDRRHPRHPRRHRPEGPGARQGQKKLKKKKKKKRVEKIAPAHLTGPSGRGPKRMAIADRVTQKARFRSRADLS